MTPTTQEGRNITPAISAFLRDHFAPVAKPAEIYGWSGSFAQKQASLTVGQSRR